MFKDGKFHIRCSRCDDVTVLDESDLEMMKDKKQKIDAKIDEMMEIKQADLQDPFNVIDHASKNEEKVKVLKKERLAEIEGRLVNTEKELAEMLLLISNLTAVISQLSQKVSPIRIQYAHNSQGVVQTKGTY